MSDTLIDFMKIALRYIGEYSVRIVLAGIVLFAGFKFSAYLSKKYPKFKAENKVPAEAATFIKSAINIVGKIIIAITAIAIVGRSQPV